MIPSPPSASAVAPPPAPSSRRPSRSLLPPLAASRRDDAGATPERQRRQGREPWIAPPVGARKHGTLPPVAAQPQRQPQPRPRQPEPPQPQHQTQQQQEQFPAARPASPATTRARLDTLDSLFSLYTEVSWEPFAGLQGVDGSDAAGRRTPKSGNRASHHWEPVDGEGFPATPDGAAPAAATATSTPKYGAAEKGEWARAPALPWGRDAAERDEDGGFSAASHFFGGAGDRPDGGDEDATNTAPRDTPKEANSSKNTAFLAEMSSDHDGFAEDKRPALLQEEAPIAAKGKKKIELTASSAILDQIVAAATLRDDDEASDVSSLSDTVSFQRQSPRAPRRKSAAAAPGGGGPASSVAVMAQLLKRSVGRRRPPPPEPRDTVTTAGSGSCLSRHTLQTIDRSLEQNLFRSGREERRRWGSRGGAPSPLGAVIARETGRPCPARSGGSGRSPVALGAASGAPPAHERWAGARHAREPPPAGGCTGPPSGQYGGSLARSGASGELRRHCHRRAASHGSRGSEGLRPPVPVASGAHGLRAPSPADAPKPGGPTIDVEAWEAWDEPVDPFSGLIGMPSSIGCERSVLSIDGGSYVGMNVFGTAAAARPPRADGRAAAKSAPYNPFDPLAADRGDFHSLSSSARSPLPPRHHRDDPLLSKSRYHRPQFAYPRSSAQASQKRAAAHRRGSSLGSAGGVCPRNACMFGSVALSETTRSPLTPRGSWDGPEPAGSGGGAECASVGSHGGGAGAAASAPGSDAATPDPATPSSLRDGDVATEGDERSHGSFSQEYHRPAPVHRIVAKEMKHIIGKVFPVGTPVVKAGRKLLGVSKPEAAMQRSEGCLT